LLHKIRRITNKIKVNSYIFSQQARSKRLATTTNIETKTAKFNTKTESQTDS